MSIYASTPRGRRGKQAKKAAFAHRAKTVRGWWRNGVIHIHGKRSQIVENGRNVVERMADVMFNGRNARVRGAFVGGVLLGFKDGHVEYRATSDQINGREPTSVIIDEWTELKP